jgi:thymidylate synthase
MSNILKCESTNLSIAWADAFLGLMSPEFKETTTLIVSITDIVGAAINEDKQIRQILDKALEARKTSCHTIANTIFPQSLWNPSRERALLYERYTKYAWPRVKKCSANRRGTYFQRLVAFENGEIPINQLEHVISTWLKGNHRHSALQVSIFDPKHDHTNCRQMGFPCLHQICFTPMGANGRDGLAITGFYATQHIFEKAYGNYLGLCRLGQFVAHEMGLRFVQMTCIAASAKLGVDQEIKKADLHPLELAVANRLNEIKKQSQSNNPDEIIRQPKA